MKPQDGELVPRTDDAGCLALQPLFFLSLLHFFPHAHRLCLVCVLRCVQQEQHYHHWQQQQIQQQQQQHSKHCNVLSNRMYLLGLCIMAFLGKCNFIHEKTFTSETQIQYVGGLKMVKMEENGVQVNGTNGTGLAHGMGYNGPPCPC